MDDAMGKEVVRVQERPPRRGQNGARAVGVWTSPRGKEAGSEKIYFVLIKRHRRKIPNTGLRTAETRERPVWWLESHWVELNEAHQNCSVGSAPGG